MRRTILIALIAFFMIGLSDAHSQQGKNKEVPVQAQVGFHDTVLIPINTNEITAVVYNVPSNKYLIIEDVGGDLRGRRPTDFTYPHEGALRIMIQTFRNQTNIEHFIGLAPILRGLSPDNPLAVVARPVRLVADPGTAVTCIFTRNYRGIEDNVGCSFSGRLVDGF